MGLNNFLRPAKDAKEESERKSASRRESAFKDIVRAVNRKIDAGEASYRFNDADDDDDYEDDYPDHYWDADIAQRFKDAGYDVNDTYRTIIISWR